MPSRRIRSGHSCEQQEDLQAAPVPPWDKAYEVGVQLFHARSWLEKGLGKEKQPETRFWRSHVARSRSSNHCIAEFHQLLRISVQGLCRCHHSRAPSSPKEPQPVGSGLSKELACCLQPIVWTQVQRNSQQGHIFPESFLDSQL